MSFFEVKTTLAILFVASGLVAVASMMTLMGRSERRMSVPALKTIHRIAGYTFAVLLVVLGAMGLSHLSSVGDSLPLRGVLHWSLASMLVFVLALKIVVARWFKQFLTFVPVMGMIIIALALVVATLSAVFFVLAGGSGSASESAVRLEARNGEIPTDSGSEGQVGETVASSIGRGERVFGTYCSGCHYDDSTDAKVGPGLAGLFLRDRIAASGKAMSPGNVRAQIIDPAGSMPSFEGHLTDQQLDDILSYLETL
jgi:hypothetical protein